MEKKGLNSFGDENSLKKEYIKKVYESHQKYHQANWFLIKNILFF